MKYDFIGIGDVTTDCFIKLKDAEELTNHGVVELCMPFGTKIPYESATEVWATGNSSNAPLCVSKLGLSAALVSSVGGDDNGKKIMESRDTRCCDRIYGRPQGHEDELLLHSAIRC